MERSSREITITSTLLVVLSCIFAAVLLSFASFSPGGTTLGWIAVCGASLIFSTTTVPMKEPKLRTLNVDPMVFALFTGIGIFIVSIPITLFLESRSAFVFLPFSILASADIFVINFFAIRAVELLGVAVAPGVWAGVGMVTSFVLGTFVFNEHVANTTFAGVAMALLVVGVYCVSTSKGPAEAIDKADAFVDDQKPETSGQDQDQDQEQEQDQEQVQIEYLELSKEEPPCHQGPDKHQQQTDNHSLLSTFFSGLGCSSTSGLGFCLCTGLCDGALMAPFKLSLSYSTPSQAQAQAQSGFVSLTYLASFGLAAGFVSPLLFFAYVLVSRRTIPRYDQFRGGAFPGLASGILWACANLLGVLGTSSLGMSVSFPITQTCALISACWGLCFFDEHLKDRFRFAAGLVCVILGSYFLAASAG